MRLPGSSGSDGPAITARTIEASQASRLATSTGTGPTWSSSAEPSRSRSASTLTVTVRWGRSPPTCGRSERSSHCRQTSPKASARR